MKDRLGCEDLPDDRRLERYVAGELSRAEGEEIERHYLVCAICQDDLRLALELEHTLPRLGEHGLPQAPAREVVAAGGGAESLRGGSRSPARRVAGSRSVRVSTAVALAAAATLAGVLLLGPSITDDGSAPAHRDEVTPAAAEPTVISPIGRVRALVEFRWSPVPTADLYRVTVYDGSGETVWEAETEATRLAVPPRMEMKPDARYFWTVSAHVSWGRWVSSDIVEFSRED